MTGFIEQESLRLSESAKRLGKRSQKYAIAGAEQADTNYCQMKSVQYGLSAKICISLILNRNKSVIENFANTKRKVNKFVGVKIQHYYLTME